MQKIHPDQIGVFWGKSKGMRSLSQILVNVLLMQNMVGIVPNAVKKFWLHTFNKRMYILKLAS